MPPRRTPTVEYVPLEAVKPHPRNPRQGDIGLIMGLIATTGWHTVVTVQRRDGQPDLCLAGWHRSEALRWLVRDGWTNPDTGEHLSYDELAEHVRLPPKGKVPVEPLAIDDDEALQKLVGDNRANDLADYDEGQLVDILSDLAEADLLVGTGYEGADVDDLIASLNETGPMRGDQEREQMIAQWAVVIECRNEEDQRAILAELTERGLNVRALVR